MTTTYAFPLATTVTEKLEAEAIRYAAEARLCRANGDKDGAKEAQRAANSFSRALDYWRAGIRPELTDAGNWLLPSQRGPQEPPHLLHLNGDWVCTCCAGESWHWAKALIIGVELAQDADDLPFDLELEMAGALPFDLDSEEADRALYEAQMQQDVEERAEDLALYEAHERQMDREYYAAIAPRHLIDPDECATDATDSPRQAAIKALKAKFAAYNDAMNKALCWYGD